MQRAVGKAPYLVGWGSQAVRLAVFKTPGQFSVPDDHASFRRDQQHGPVLQLAAVHWVRHWTAVGAVPWNTQAEQEASLGVHLAIGRFTSTVQGVARRTRLGVERGSQAVAGRGGGGRGYPILAEKAVSDDEGAPLAAFEVAGRETEGIASAGEGGGVAPKFLHQHDLRSVRRAVPIKDDKVNHRCQYQGGGQDKNRRPLHSGG